ncbi:MAG: prolyl oligopeptidase family serine peptidase [Steroidobacteraceae bacterium]
MLKSLAGALTALVASVSLGAQFTMDEVLHYPYASELAAAADGDAIAWVRNTAGVRNVWIARGPDFTPQQVTQYTADDGQEITHLTFSPDGTHLVYVRGGDHDANWPAEGNLAPDPDSSPEQPLVTIWSMSVSGGSPTKVAEGDAPAISARGQLAYVKDHQVWSAPLDGQGRPERLFFDRGKDDDLQWSRDGSLLAFVSDRTDHSFIGVFSSKETPLLYLAPSTDKDSSPRWSPDGTRLAFVRRPGDGGPPKPLLTRTPDPWSIWVASATDGSGHAVWQSPETLAGSYPDVEGRANLHWAAGARLVFLAYLDEWPHLYSLPAAGHGLPVLLTPGPFMVEHVAESRDGRFMIYDANTGSTPDDGDRRHLFRVAVDRAGSLSLTSGTTLEWTPVSAAAKRVAFVTAGPREPPTVGMVGIDGRERSTLDAGAPPADFPVAKLLVPKAVVFNAADGTAVHGQLFESAAASRAPGIVFVHGGPPRQMLLGWHYMDYYSNAYAVNQYLATHGYIVLSVNYRLGIGYGRAFHQPEHAGPRGAAEYQDVLAAARYLQGLPGVDATRIGIWGGSYGGYLTALGLARDSEVFKAGVDLHGVHDFTRTRRVPETPPTRYEKGDLEEATAVAWQASPDASVDGWKSPVLLIQGDDDRNVSFQQTVDLARRLEARHVPYEELVLPNEIHGFLRHSSWLRADTATADFFARTFGVAAN